MSSSCEKSTDKYTGKPCPVQAGYSGVIFAVIAAVTYGMNPLFALPLYANGFDVDSVLFVRYLPATILLGILVKLRGQHFRVTWKELGGCIICGLLFACTSCFLFLSYTKMDAGIASTLLFVYPIMVVPIMAIGFRERITWNTIFCILLSCVGVGLLCRTSSGGFLSLIGIVYVLLSALSYGVYLVTVNRLNWVKSMDPAKLTFYVVFFCLFFFFIRIEGGLGFQGSFSPFVALNIAGLSLISTATSIGFTSLALPRLGATGTSIIGALEPLTAVFFGVTVFHETLTPRIACGIILILASVILIALKRPQTANSLS
ncbi:MAG: DMT family transporter [Planctomycetia bacterium]|nr:DMT family transporter [Planctomycetia bacterium]